MLLLTLFRERRRRSGEEGEVCSRETEFHSYLEEGRQLSLSQLGLCQQKPAKTDDFFHPKFSGLNTHNVQNSVKNHVSIKGHEKSQLE